MKNTNSLGICLCQFLVYPVSIKRELMEPLKIIIPGDPIVGKRHRTSFRTKHHYDPQKAEKQTIGFHFWKARNELLLASHYPLSGAIRLDATFFMPIPKSLSDKKRLALHGKPHDKRPDQSNMLKFYEDAANAILFHDDGQICYSIIRKFWDLEPRLEIVLSKIEHEK